MAVGGVSAGDFELRAQQSQRTLLKAREPLLLHHIPSIVQKSDATVVNTETAAMMSMFHTVLGVHALSGETLCLGEGCESLSNLPVPWIVWPMNRTGNCAHNPFSDKEMRGGRLQCY
jgi:hypothetical protein